MDKLKLLQDKIEELRGDLNQAIANNLPIEVIYEKSVALDKLIEQYIDMTWSYGATRKSIWVVFFYQNYILCSPENKPQDIKLPGKSSIFQAIFLYLEHKKLAIVQKRG